MATGLRFVQIGAGDADIAFDITNTGYSYAWHPDSGGDVRLSTREAVRRPEAGGYGHHTIQHEIGHALGLVHPHENGMPPEHDFMERTVMSYRSVADGGLLYTNETAGYAQTLMPLDLAALQAKYGADREHLDGDTEYRWDPDARDLLVDGEATEHAGAPRVFRMLWDGGGEDTLDLSEGPEPAQVDLRPGRGTVISADLLARLDDEGRTASANIYNARVIDGDRRPLIENAVGTAFSDALIGNAAANRLTGGGGGDRLHGKAGADVMAGCSRNDRLFGGAGDDELRGGRGADRLAGGEGDDLLRGGPGADRFVFRPSHGSDVVADWEPGRDRLVLKDGLPMPAFEVVDAGVLLRLEGGTVILAGIRASEVSADDILLV